MLFRSRVAAHEIFLEGRVLLHQSLLANDVLFTLRGVEVDGQFDSLCLVDAKRQIALLL